MLFSVERNRILKELQYIQGIIEQKNTIPILANLLLQAEGKEIRVTATDLEVGLKSTCRADIEKEGAVTIAAKKFYEIVRLLPESEILVELSDNDMVQVTCDKVYFRINSLPIDDFPALPTCNFDKALEIPAPLLKEFIRKTFSSIPLEDTRYALLGAFFMTDGHVFRMVSTDTHRLAFVEKKAKKKKSAGPQMSVIVPRKTLNEIRTLLDDKAEKVLFVQDGNHIFFNINDRVLISRVLEGEFPNYEKVLPSKYDKEITLKRAELQMAIKRVSLLSSERSHAINLQVKDGELTVCTSNPQLGEAKEILNIEYSGEELEVRYNSQYLLDFLNIVDCEEIVFALKGESYQCIMLPKDDKEKDTDYRYVLMPMRF
jgi:DNA polymerase-3 subunit beta